MTFNGTTFTDEANRDVQVRSTMTAQYGQVVGAGSLTLVVVLHDGPNKALAVHRLAERTVKGGLTAVINTVVTADRWQWASPYNSVVSAYDASFTWSSGIAGPQGRTRASVPPSPRPDSRRRPAGPTGRPAISPLGSEPTDTEPAGR